MMHSDPDSSSVGRPPATPVRTRLGRGPRDRHARQWLAWAVVAVSAVLPATAAGATNATKPNSSRSPLAVSVVVTGDHLSVRGTVSGALLSGEAYSSRWVVTLQRRVGTRWTPYARGRPHPWHHGESFSLAASAGPAGSKEVLRVAIVSGRHAIATSASVTVSVPWPSMIRNALPPAAPPAPTQAGPAAPGVAPLAPSAFAALQVTGGGGDACVLLRFGGVDCWGSDLDGVLGVDKTWPTPSVGPSVEYSEIPTPVAGISGATQISAGYFYVCALSEAKTVSCWGWDGDGQLGNGEYVYYTGVVQPMDLQYDFPNEVKGLGGVRQISTGDSNSCALLDSGAIDCWGANGAGQLGIGNAASETCAGAPCSTRPVRVSGITTATEIASGGSTTCALLATGSVDCWGLNRYGTVGDGTTINRTQPTPVLGVTNAIKITVGEDDACAIVSGGTIDCWGWDEQGQLGDGNSTGPETCQENQKCSTRPVAVSKIASAVEIAASSAFFEDHTCALLAAGNVECWGSGPLGNGTNASSDLPIEVMGLSSANSVGTAAGGVSCATLTSGALDCWGGGSEGLTVPIPEAKAAPE